MDEQLIDLVEWPSFADVRLATTELVTNAVRHGGLRDDQQISLEVDLTRGCLRVSVEQPSEATEVRIVQPSPGRDRGGFGLLLVEHVSETWGVDVGPPGRVWFEMHTDGT